MSWLAVLLAWLGIGTSGFAKPPPPLKLCTSWTQRAIPYIDNGALNCTDGPIYESGVPTSISLDDVTVAATPKGLSFSYLVGTGNVTACLDPEGNLYRGSPGC